jgi:hypothetical protein
MAVLADVPKADIPMFSAPQGRINQRPPGLSGSLLRCPISGALLVQPARYDITTLDIVKVIAVKTASVAAVPVAPVGGVGQFIKRIGWRRGAVAA